jgi:maltooligosyltrehalose trehalohydrolase
MTLDRRLGAIYASDDVCHFIVWAPTATTVDVHIQAPDERIIPLMPKPRGYFEGAVSGVAPGSLYTYRLDGDSEWPDPASRSQPEGPHGPSAVVDPAAFPWTDAAWRGVPQDRLVLYELHVGTFSIAGTFDGVISFLPYLKDLGVTALEIMPVAQFPGERNWGYDGVALYAPQNSYGGPDGFRRLIDASHAAGLAVHLDCVYNHFGPEGNYTGLYGNYTTDTYHSPWGDAINMDGPGSAEVRRFFIENALHWVREYHVDGFRLDATDRIIDESATHFLQELSIAIHDEAERLGRHVIVIAESDANDVRYIQPPAVNGHGLDGQWGDDFHHALHALLTGERTGYYAGFGTLRHLAKAFRQNFVYDGVYSDYRERRHGNSPAPAAARQFVVASQNHDQVGNRAAGERLTQLVSFESAKLAAAAYLLSPYIPLIFMGEEFAETAPFLYFTSHTDPDLARAVSEGRRNEFKRFNWQRDVPDPQDPATFHHSKLDHQLREEVHHRAMLELYRELIRLRRELPALAHLSKNDQEVIAYDLEQTLVVRRWRADHETLVALSFAEQPSTVEVSVAEGAWRLALDTADARWRGKGSGLPVLIESDGRITLTIQGRSAVVLEHVIDTEPQ